MDTRALIRLLLLNLLLNIAVSCETNQIKLEPVRSLNLPEYIFTDRHFGRDPKSMEELNEFLLMTGKIDTTSEFPPEKIAIIKINGKNCFLTNITDTIINQEINQQYEGSGYHLMLQFKHDGFSNGHNTYQGKLIIKNLTTTTEHKVSGADGYH